MIWKKTARLIFACGLCVAVGGFGSFATQSSLSDWYPLLNKPVWTPPNWIFAPVWTSLYLMMGLSAWLVWEKVKVRGDWSPLMVFGIQLALNGAWSWLFFYFKSPGAGAVNIALLWIAILATILKFYRESRWAAWLLAPYLIWVSYAAALNFEIFRLN